jgi:hypothetical protein
VNGDSENNDRAKSDVSLGMHSDANTDAHERARLMIALSGVEESSFADQSWLAAHLEACQPCREFEEHSRAAIRGMRGIPITAGGRLVSTTQMRVRQRAAELRRQQERVWVVFICCAAVTLFSAVSVAFLWHGFEWMGRQARLSAPVWEGGFAVFYLMPAVLAGIFLLARGTFLADHYGPHQDSSFRE